MLQSIASPLPADTSSPGLDFIPFLTCAVQTVQTNKIRAEEQIGRVPFLTNDGLLQELLDSIQDIIL